MLGLATIASGRKAARKGCPAAIVCSQGAAIEEQAQLPVQAYLLSHKQYVPRAPKPWSLKGREGKAENVATCRITLCKAETTTVFKFKTREEIEAELTASSEWSNPMPLLNAHVAPLVIDTER